MGRAKYKIVTCPSEDAQRLEDLLNDMSKAGWDLYTMHEVETETGFAYNCIFVTDVNEEEQSDSEELEVFKNRMEKILTQDDSPYQKCLDVQKKITEKRKKIEEIKTKLEAEPLDKREHLNNKISTLISELAELKKQLKRVVNPATFTESIKEDKLSISLSEEVMELVDPDKNAVLVSQTVKSRQDFVNRTGFIIPSVKFIDDETLQANEFSINVRGVKAFSARVYPECLMFYVDELALKRMPKNSIRDVDQISGRDIVWISADNTKDFWAKGINAQEYIAQALEFVTVKNISEIFDYNDLNRYVDIVVENNSYLVENCVPDFISLAELKYILVNLIREHVSIKDIVYVFEKINDYSDEDVKDDLLDKLRISLSKQISADLADDSNLISVIKFSSDTIDSVINLMENEEQTIVRVDGSKLNVIIEKLLKVAKKLSITRDKIVLLVPLEVRHMVAMVLLQLIPNIRVVSEEEISADYAMEVLAEV